MATERKHLPTVLCRLLWLVPPLQVAFLWGYGVYKGSFGERDSYRILVGLVDTLIHGRSFREELPYGLLYGYDFSRGYYAALRWIVSGLRMDLHHLIDVLNALSFSCSVLCLAPLFILARAIGGRSTALISIALIYTVPAWSAVSEYAHPVWPALMFFLSATAAVALRPGLAGAGRVVCDATMVLLLAISFSMRLDVVVMAPMFLAFCIEGERFSFAALRRLALCGSLALGAVLVLRALDPVPVTGGRLDTVWQLLHGWYGPAQFISNLKDAQVAFGTAINPFLLVSLLAACGYLALRARWQALWLVLPTMAVNYIFWIPQDNVRHYLYLVPALVIGVAAAAGDIVDGRGAVGGRFGLPLVATVLGVGLAGALRPLFGAELAYFSQAVLAAMLVAAAYRLLQERFPRSHALRAGLIAVSALVMLIGVVRWQSFAIANQFPPGRAGTYTRLADALLALPSIGKTVLVVTDANPIVATMQSHSARPLGLDGNSPPECIKVTSEHNRFEFFIQGWLREAVIAWAISRSTHTRVVLLVDGSVAPGVASRLQSQPNIELLAWGDGRH